MTTGRKRIAVVLLAILAFSCYLGSYLYFRTTQSTVYATYDGPAGFFVIEEARKERIIDFPFGAWGYWPLIRIDERISGHRVAARK